MTEQELGAKPISQVVFQDNSFENQIFLKLHLDDCRELRVPTFAFMTDLFEHVKCELNFNLKLFIFYHLVTN